MIKTPIPATRQPETDIDRYHAWLTSHVTHTSNKQPIATIAPSQSAQRTWTTPQITILSILATLTLVALWTFGIAVLTLLFALVTVLYVALLALSTAWMIAVSRSQSATPFDDEMVADLSNAPWPHYTVLCPLYHEKVVVPQFVQAMQALDYPQDCLQVLFLTEQDDRETRAAIRALNLPANYEILIVPQGTPKTKPRACNYGLSKATGDFVVIFDAEDVPDTLQLKKAVLTFASNAVNVACVQARLNFYNIEQNILTRFFCTEYTLWFDLVLPGLQRLGFSLPLGGTSNHFRISALRALGGWDTFNVTEDCDLGLKLAKYQFRTIMLDSTTYEEANSRVLSWIKQRSRWIKGYMQTYLVHTRSPLKAIRQGKVKDLLSLHLFVGAGSIVLLVNPLMWAMFAAYLVWRPVELYHHLFPWPVLYAGMLCFLVGNFLPIYVSMIACVKREHYSLVKWCLLLPVYWGLASIAVILAGYELFTAPHKWRKTEHGLHLKDRKSTAKVAAISMKAATVSGVSVAGVGTVTQSVRAISTMPMPAVMRERLKRAIPHDKWVYAIIIFASLCSIFSTAYYFLHHDILLYGDAYSHMNIARSVIDNFTPGLAQLGGVWLPLPHLLMIPFVWNNYLWETGLAGSIPAMGCYVTAALFLFLSARGFTHNNWCSFAGVLVFLLNPNVLYLQSTPLSEPVCFATFAIASYFFIVWAQENKLKYLVLAAAGAFLSTIARYDGWFLFLSMFVLIGVICLLRKRKFQQSIATLILMGLLGSLGIILWFVWNKIIFGDPLYFQHGVYSSQNQMQYFYAHSFGTRGNLFLSVKYYVYAIIDTFGPIVSILAALSCIIFYIMWKRDRYGRIAALSFLSPLAFYAFSFYSGQVIIMVPGVSSTIFNARFGTEAALPSAFFIATLLSIIPRSKYFAGLLAPITLSGVIILQSFLVAHSGIVSLEDGQYGLSCMSANAIDIYLSKHYNEGTILEDTYLGSPNEGAEVGIPIHHIINQGSGVFWHRALKNPGLMAEWVIVGLRQPGSKYPVQVNTDAPLFKDEFMLVVNDTTNASDYRLYLRKGLPPLPNTPVPARLLNEYLYCGTGKRP